MLGRRRNSRDISASFRVPASRFSNRGSPQLHISRGVAWPIYRPPYLLPLTHSLSFFKMTVIIPPVRNLSQSLLSRSHLLARASLSSSPLLRVTCKYTAGNACPNTSQSFLLDSALPLRPRSYATTSSTRPIGRPKAHTGRTAAKRTTPGASSGTSKSRSKKAGRKAKAKKPKPKPKKRPVSKTAQKKAEAQKSRDLREKALLKPPKKLPETAWTVLFSENAVKGSPVSGDAAKSAAQKYRNLSPEELEVGVTENLL